MVETRLWRPAAQRSVRNAWSHIQGHRSAWSSASAAALSAATSLVNAYLLHSDVEAMEFGVLGDMESIKEKARVKLRRKLETYLGHYQASYEDLVQSVSQLTSAALSMRTYLKITGSGRLITFTNEANLEGDSGDGGGVPVFATLPLGVHERLASEIASMFQRELNVKWLLASEFCKLVHLDFEEATTVQREVSPPVRDDSLMGPMASSADEKSKEGNNGSGRNGTSEAKPPNRETLQVYLTALLAEVYVNKDRIEQISRIYSEEMTVGLFGSP